LAERPIKFTPARMFTAPAPSNCGHCSALLADVRRGSPTPANRPRPRRVCLCRHWCVILGATFPARRLAEAKAEHPGAAVVAHPECPASVLAMADFIGSTSAIVEWCASSRAAEFIVMTESGIRFSLQKVAPGKRFYFVANENCNCSECPYMKLNTLEKLRDCLLALAPRVELPDAIVRRALVPLERMLALK